ncbi:Rri2p NDAI_0G04010 [Naumovozyma dairenensis CBS 421]|uniref:PCI domain-containing protein n=1 Tax=Naumovozyma dairenensis (strain ATCC 10597 / BCRC 20456 / CBS 421 / NBRC 0211 / NRRL Y-12639) TaxID=1071378 RepID=G0WEG7_NAUDC|nr:hypothetical protein NDAI_0G04010 [Naumovozyma dairenensis CBS 421]CCD26178.2 hypothetical protein NDAI_0G04010 [Naumovozyma dairenensis CBS 421]
MPEEYEDYDDFMMSDDESMNIDDIAFESDEGQQEHHTVGSSKETETTRYFPNIEYAYNTGLAFLDDREFEKAREQFIDVYKTVIDILPDDKEPVIIQFGFQALNQIISCWINEIPYNGMSGQIVSEIIRTCECLCDFIAVNNDDHDTNNLAKNLGNTFTTLFYSNSRIFLFDLGSLDCSAVKLRMELQSAIVSIFLNSSCLHKKFVPLLQVKGRVSSIWYDCLTTGYYSESDLSSLRSIRVIDNETEKYTEDLKIEITTVILQCYILEFLKAGDIKEAGYFKESISILDKLASKSLSVSQTPEVMLILHFSQGIMLLMTKRPDINSSIQTSVFWRMREAREAFLRSLKHLEELGRNQDKTPHLFHDIILAGFTFTSMILLKVGKEELDPFEFEQVRILGNQDIIDNIQLIYVNFMNLDLMGLFNSLNCMKEINFILHHLVSDIYELAQSLVLWTKIAVVYSCISIPDLENKLKLNEYKVPTRDDILTLLMQSILKGEAMVFYKLDLRKDLVYFGAMYKKQLTMYGKESFRLMNQNKRKPAEAKECESLASLSDFEYANNVGLFTVPRKLTKKSNITEFFEALKEARENIIYIDNAQHKSFNKLYPKDMKFTDKYMNLVDLMAPRIHD